MKHLGTKTGGPHHVINIRRGASPFLHSVIGGELQYHSQTTINLSLSLCLFVYHFPQDSPRCLCPMWYNQWHHQLHHQSCSNACFFFGGLSCTKSCSNACFSFLRFAVHQIVQSVLLLLFYLCSENDKYGKTKNERFCIVFLIGAWARIWPQPGQPPKPRRTLNHYCI